MSDLVSLFAPEWYLAAYPDVAAAGVDPLQHYLDYGRYEGRWPCEIVSIRLENELWSGDTGAALEQLNALLQSTASRPLDYFHAAWALARWHGSFGRWPEVLRHMRMFRSSPTGGELISHLGPVLLEFTALTETGHIAGAKALLADIANDKPDLLLAASMLADSDRLSHINQLFRNACLVPVSLINPREAAGLDNIAPSAIWRISRQLLSLLPDSRQQPCVSIIIPAFNAERTLPAALRSLQQQSWRNLEIIVVDDVSTDSTHAVALGFAAKDRRIRVLKHKYNQGAYVSRNTGLAMASGDYLTVHDSDDWSHPQKIEKQVAVLENDLELKACLSHWVRSTSDLKFSHWYVETGWIYRNMSSLMFRRSVFDTLGYWDRVRVGADTEYMLRIQRVFGQASIADALPGIPLSFGRYSPASLSQTSATHLRTQFKGVRKDYRDATLKWYRETTDTRALFLPEKPLQRPFPAPAEIEIAPDKGLLGQAIRLLDQSGLFDVNWYLQSYPDVASSGADPVRHYLLHGGPEDRDPGPGFSASGYKYICPDPDIFWTNPLLHFIQTGLSKGYAALPELPGDQEQHPDRQTILLCAHASGRQIFGAERSLLDVLSGLRQLGFNIIVSVPGAGNSDYIAALRQLAIKVICLPCPWWRQDRTVLAGTRAQFERILRENRIDAVYANTIVLWEPLLAAKASGIPAIVHARELPGSDPDLCTLLRANAESIRRHVLDHADHIIANSSTVARYFSGKDNVSVVPNTIDPDAFDIPNAINTGLVRVAMIGSNLPKKGLHDFARLAARLAATGAPVSCVLIGPENEHTAELRREQVAGLEFAGYADTPQAALREANIVVNLSHVEESFGRTVLEAMAARRPVIAYDRGALPELIRNGVNGYLASFGDIEDVARKVRLFVEQPGLLARMGEAGRQLAIERYGNEAFVRQLKTALSGSLND